MNQSRVSDGSVVITDTSCFILLEKINALFILPKLFATILTTPEIAAEFGKPLPEWVIIREVNQLLKQKFLRQVDPGEASAIAMASEIFCDYIILDDMAARKLAESLGFKVKGTIGILLLAKQKAIIAHLRPYLEIIQQTNFRLSSRLVDQFIKEAGE